MLVQIPRVKGQFLGERTCLGMRKDTALSGAKMAAHIEMSFGLWTLGPRKCVLHGVHIGANWQIQLNCSCSGGPNIAAAMWPYVKLL